MTTAMPVACWIPGKPVPWKRVRRGAGGHAFTDDRDQAWRNRVRAEWVRQIGLLNWRTGPVWISLVFCGADKRADALNLAKAVEEALQARGWRDGQAPVCADDNQFEYAFGPIRIPAPTRCDAGVWICVARDG